MHVGDFDMQTPEGADGLTAGDWKHSQEAALAKTITGSAEENSLANTHTTGSADVETALCMKVCTVLDWNKKIGCHHNSGDP